MAGATGILRSMATHLTDGTQLFCSAAGVELGLKASSLAALISRRSIQLKHTLKEKGAVLYISALTVMLLGFALE